jgi:1,4-dihydroxy-2-naphthoyl-CoA hydrolase
VDEELQRQDHELGVVPKSCHELVGIRAGSLRQLPFCPLVGMHGGAIMGLADSSGGICAFLNLPDGATRTTTIESKTNFLRTVRSGDLEATSRPLHKGRSVIVIETDLMNHEGRLAARVTQSQIVLPPVAQPVPRAADTFRRT